MCSPSLLTQHNDHVIYL